MMRHAFVDCTHNDSLLLVDADHVVRHGPELSESQARLVCLGGIGWKTLDKIESRPREVTWSFARLGRGPTVYDELLTRTESYVIPSREHVSFAARRVWSFYVRRRDDVDKICLPVEIPLWNSIAPELDHGFKLVRCPTVEELPRSNLSCCDWHDLVFSMFQLSLDRG